MTPEQVKAAMAQVREARALREEMAALIEAAEIAAGLPAMRDAKATAAKLEEATREALGAWWNDLSEEQASATPKPKGLSFTCKDTTVVIDPAELPREALKPDPKAIRAGMPGTFTCAVFHARVSK